eukprot:4649059-Pyramimonas_sp.AAC.1
MPARTRARASVRLRCAALPHNARSDSVHKPCSRMCIVLTSWLGLLLGPLLGPFAGSLAGSPGW